MITVLHLMRALTEGGGCLASVYLGELANTGDRTSHAVLSLQPADPAVVRRAEARGVRVYDAPDETQRNQLIAEYDVVHLNWWHTAELNAFLRAGLPPCRLLIWYHVAGDHPPQIITGSMVDLADLAVGCSPYTYRVLNGIGSPTAKAAALAGADFSRLKDVQPQAHTGFNVGYIGTLDFTKMHPDYVAMCAGVDVPQARFLLCGQGGDAATLARQAQHLGVAERMDFRGYVADISAVLAVCDAYGYPLREDTFAAAELNLQEAMYAGVPPVVFPHGGIKDLVIHEQTGLVVHTPKQYSEALSWLYHNEEVRRRLGRAAAAYARAHFGAAHCLEQLEQHYPRLMKQPKRARALAEPKALTAIEAPGAAAFCEGLAEHAAPFLAGLASDEAAFRADRRIAQMSPLMAAADGGGLVSYRIHYPEDPIIRFWAGLYFLETGIPGRAASDFERAWNGGFRPTRLKLYWADALWRAGKQERARAVYKEGYPSDDPGLAARFRALPVAGTASRTSADSYRKR